MAKGKILLIDADVHIWKSGKASIDKETGQPGPLIHAIANLKRSIGLILDRAEFHNFKNIKDIRLYLTSDNKTALNFRQAISTSVVYKGNRKDVEKPPYYLEMKQYLFDKFQAIEVKNQEADDAVGIEACLHNPDQVLIASNDKDLRMIPGIHYELGDAPLYYAEDPGMLIKLRTKSGWKWFGTGLRWFYFQLATGDPVDNIKRPWKYKPGEIDLVANNINYYGAEKDMCDYVHTVYLEKGSDAERLAENGRLLWIRRKEGELWEPTGNIL